ncbi:hypothetical protein IUY40_07520 [Flavobacterium sp. ALJ2]|uniref:hypothetical protein n=1 Tax=Flavobacterium sp. ALJ2 TaxID=2786960 RepID=UPI00189D1B99|nr:hypothetical protein [Flavobacterium sp. ALJ2]MBF7091384.1 hypothetical protein [Flavobacterium sp. ALJ2]
MKQTLLILLSSILLISCSDKPKKQTEEKQTEEKVKEEEETTTSTLTSTSTTTSTTTTTTENKTTSGKTAIFKWDTILCSNIGTYDSEKYTEEELKNTCDLWSTNSGAYLSTNSTPRSQAEIDKLSLSDLTTEYNERKALYSRKVIATPYWEKKKAERLHELEDAYELKKIAIEAYSNPSILLNNRFSKNCNEYTKALTSNDSILMLKTWSNLAEKQKKDNASPEKLMERHLEKYNSKDRVLYAKLELMTYGWWNCANATTYQVYDDGTMEKEFEKLFIKVTSECDEP